MKYCWSPELKEIIKQLKAKYHALMIIPLWEEQNSLQQLVYKAAKKILHEAQRQSAASRRSDIKAAIRHDLC